MTELKGKLMMLLPCALLVFLLGITPGISIQEDLGRHLLLGRIILEQGSVPDTNLLTYTCQDFPFVNHHWLSEVLFYLTHAFIGLTGLIWLKALIMSGTLVLAIMAIQSRRFSALFAVTGIAAALALGFRSHIRPELFTYLGIGLFLFLFEKIRKGARWPWMGLALYSWFWANAHIYFVFGLGMIGAFFLERWWDRWRKGLSGLKSFPWEEGMVVLVTFGLGVLQPNGLKGFLYPFRIFSNYGMPIIENASPLELWKTSLNPMLLVLPILTVISVLSLIRVTLLRTRACDGSSMESETPRLGNYIVLVTALAAAWSMARSGPLLALAVLPVLGEALSLSPRRDTAESSETPTVPGSANMSRLSRLPGFLVTLLVFWLMHGVVQGWYCRIFPAPMGPTPFGLEREESSLGLKTLVKEGLPGPVFTDYNIGSLVEYCIYPEKGYVDNRPEAFPADFWQREYLPSLELGQDWEKVRQARNIQTVIVSPTGVREGFIMAMMKNPSWRLVHLDHVAAVWVLAENPSNRAFIESHLFTVDALHGELARIDGLIDSLDSAPVLERQARAHEAVFRLYSLLCIGALQEIWPRLWRLYEIYPDYQAVHEMLRIAVPKDRAGDVEPILQARAKWPLSAKQVTDWAWQLHSRGRTNEALKVLERGRIFFPFSTVISTLTQEMTRISANGAK